MDSRRPRACRMPRRRGRPGRRRLVDGGGAGALRRRRADADRPGPYRRIQRQPADPCIDADAGPVKVQAMAERVQAINPQCVLTLVDDFVSPENVAQVLPGPYTVIIDCTDQAAAKIAMILHARAGRAHAAMRRRGRQDRSAGAARRRPVGGGERRAAVRCATSCARSTALRARPIATARRSSGCRRWVHALWFDQPAILPDAWTRPTEGETRWAPPARPSRRRACPAPATARWR